jgi:hypothetical protein
MIAAIVGLATSCSSTSTVATDKQPIVAPQRTTTDDIDKETAMMKTESPSPIVTVVAQPLSPKSEASAWLKKAEASKLEFRAPIEVTLDALGISACFLGFDKDRIEAKVNDSRLGISLSDRASAWCKGAGTCAMWVWAQWQDGTLVVNKAEGKIEDGDRSLATHIHVAK